MQPVMVISEWVEAGKQESLSGYGDAPRRRDGDRGFDASGEIVHSRYSCTASRYQGADIPLVMHGRRLPTTNSL